MRKLFLFIKGHFWRFFNTFRYYLFHYHTVMHLLEKSRIKNCKRIDIKLSTTSHLKIKVFYKGAAFFDKNVYVMAKIGINSYDLKNEANLADCLNSFGLPFINKYYYHNNLSAKHHFYSIVLCRYIDKPFKTLCDISLFDKKKFYKNILIILDAFKNLHIHHNDFSKRNIMVNPDGDVIMVDFGLSHIDEIENLELYKHEFWGNGFRYVSSNSVVFSDSYGVEWILAQECPGIYKKEDLSKRYYPFEVSIR